MESRVARAGELHADVWGERIFVTQASEDGQGRSVVCYNRKDGAKLWESGATYTEQEETHETNPQGSSSPSTDGRHVFAWFGSAGVFCFDFNGKEIWRRDLGKQSHEWGYGASPVLHGDLCILNFGPGKRAFLIALNKKTGETVWQVDIPEVQPAKRTDGFAGRQGVIGSWSTPIVINVNGRDELIMAFPEKLRAFAPATGKELWSCDGLNPLLYASPIHGDGIVVAMGGFFGEHMAVRAGGQGNVTATHRLWHQVKNKSGIGSGVIHNGHIYLLGGSIAFCWELMTGKLVWDERVIPTGASSDSWSSMVLVNDRIYVLNHSGETIVLRASPNFERIAVNSLGGERTNSSLAVSDSELFIRTHKHLWCIRAAGDAKKTAADTRTRTPKS
jgi:outer membrane protein assembly factor BamB